MQNVRVDKNKLVVILTENLAKHKTEYVEAMTLYLRDFRQQLEAKLDLLDKDATPEQRFDNMPVPQSYEQDYVRVLRMLDLSEDDTITLTQSEFSQYVQDEWGWKHQFDATTMNYSSKFG